MLLSKSNDKMVMNGNKKNWGNGAVDIIEKILLFILLSPLMGVFLWCILDPEESILFGNRWKYKEELEPTEEAINFTKKTGIIGLIFTIIFYVIFVIFN